MSVLAVVLFFVYTWGFGFALTRLVKESGSFLERNAMRVGFGLSALILFGIVLNALRIPIDYRIFLVASVAAPLYCLIFKKGFRNFPRPSLKLTASSLSVIAVLLIFFISLFMYESGAFRYPYLEDDDPWGHASAATYVSIEKTVYDSPYLNFQYMDPYPPGYDMMFGILKQSSGSVYWVVKFFNALIISLSLLFFYFFAKEFTASRGKALFATFVLASVPAYLSHFIWAPALAMALFFQAMYAFEMIERDKRWKIVAGVCFASILLAHPTHAVILTGLIVIYVGIKLLFSFISDRKAWLRGGIQHVQSAIIGVALSLFWWGLKWRSMSGNLNEGFNIPSAISSASSGTGSVGIFTKLWTIVTRLFNPESGTATRAYGFADFFIAKSQNMINNPIGIGVVVSILALAGVAVIFWKLFARLRFLQQKERIYLSILLLWLVFTFLGVNSKTFNLPVGLFAFRIWMIFAIPVAIVAAEGFFVLLSLVGMFKLEKSAATAAKIILILVVVAGVFFTSSKQKYAVNTACWPAGAFWGGSLVAEPSSGCPVPSEVVAYEWLRTLPSNTRVFTFSNPDQVLAYGAFSCGWCREDREMKSGFSNATASGLYDFMKANSYEYVVIGGIEARGFGLNQTMRLINDVAASGLFTVASQAEAAVFFRTV